MILDEKAYDGGRPAANKGLIEMCNHVHAGQETERRIMEFFPKPATVIRCLVSTVAFGMGVDIPDVRFVVHWGVPSSIVTYWREVGRYARDGGPGKAILYAYPRSLNKAIVSSDMLEFCKKVANGECIRVSVLNNFSEKAVDITKFPKGLSYCTNCK
jgi:superfamily II DNA helicase RecQ